MIEPQLARGTKPMQHVEEIRRAAERGRDLVDSILTFGRRTDARSRPVQVRTLLKEAASFLRVSLPSGVELIVDDVSDDITVSGEPAQLQQVILNLCTNAAQAIDDRGHIHVAAKLEEVTDPLQVGDAKLLQGSYVFISVSDDGRGFDLHIARRMFEPFFTTRLAGTGLGLATVREILLDHDGAVGVKSEPGRGSRFEVWLPATVGTGNTTVGPSTLPLGRGETVLIFESDRERLLRDEEKLAALGYEPVGFEKASDALVACRSEPNRFDLILISSGWQAQGGLELARGLAEVAPSKPILLAVASSIDINVGAIAEAGISEVLPWPLATTDLASGLERCLRPRGRLQP